MWGKRTRKVTRPSQPGGSPPRVWGKLRAVLQAAGGRRFTPTRVGKTTRSAAPTAPTSVHPHACGENSVLLYARVVRDRFTPTRVGKTPAARCQDGALPGSPPRVWGKRLPHIRHAGRQRFTPTRVGKTGPTSPACRTTPVHPHACGENVLRSGAASPFAGSPPRVWGKRMFLFFRQGRRRFTPTRVGKTP